MYSAPNSKAERFKFNTNDKLRDVLVCGIKDEKIQQTFLSDKGLDLPKAL